MSTISLLNARILSRFLLISVIVDLPTPYFSAITDWDNVPRSLRISSFWSIVSTARLCFFADSPSFAVIATRSLCSRRRDVASFPILAKGQIREGSDKQGSDKRGYTVYGISLWWARFGEWHHWLQQGPYTVNQPNCICTTRCPTGIEKRTMTLLETLVDGNWWTLFMKRWNDVHGHPCNQWHHLPILPHYSKTPHLYYGSNFWHTLHPVLFLLMSRTFRASCRGFGVPIKKAFTFGLACQYYQWQVCRSCNFNITAQKAFQCNLLSVPSNETCLPWAGNLSGHSDEDVMKPVRWTSLWQVGSMQSRYWGCEPNYVPPTIPIDVSTPKPRPMLNSFVRNRLGRYVVPPATPFTWGGMACMAILCILLGPGPTHARKIDSQNSLITSVSHMTP